MRSRTPPWPCPSGPFSRFSSWTTKCRNDINDYPTIRIQNACMEVWVKSWTILNFWIPKKLDTLQKTHNYTTRTTVSWSFLPSLSITASVLKWWHVSAGFVANPSIVSCLDTYWSDNKFQVIVSYCRPMNGRWPVRLSPGLQSTNQLPGKSAVGRSFNLSQRRIVETECRSMSNLQWNKWGWWRVG